MSAKYISVDRRRPFLLPPDLQDWVLEDDMVHFVIEAVEGLSMKHFKVNQRGTGSAQYPPRMLPSLLIYCCAISVFSPVSVTRACQSQCRMELVCLAHSVKKAASFEKRLIGGKCHYREIEEVRQTRKTTIQSARSEVVRHFAAFAFCHALSWSRAYYYSDRLKSAAKSLTTSDLRPSFSDVQVRPAHRFRR